MNKYNNNFLNFRNTCLMIKLYYFVSIIKIIKKTIYLYAKLISVLLFSFENRGLSIFINYPIDSNYKSQILRYNR